MLNVIQIQKRKTSAANGLWHGYVKNGWMAYYLGKNPLVALTNVLYYSVKSPFYTGAAYFWGYLSSAIKREKKIKDPEIRAYYQELQGFQDCLPGFLEFLAGTQEIHTKGNSECY